jgi:hypothetical protein
MNFFKHIRHYNKQFFIPFAGAICIGLISFPVKAQLNDSLPFCMNMKGCVAYAINHQLSVQQLKIDEAITERIIITKLADWYPQLNQDYNIRHCLQQPIITNPLVVDTPETQSYQKRMEFQQLETQQQLLQYNLTYAKWSQLPTVSFSGDYNLPGLNNAFSNIYAAGYPNAIFGPTFSVPIFQGTARIQGVKLELHRPGWNFSKSEINY